MRFEAFFWNRYLRTVIRRLAKKGYKMDTKMNKDDPSPQLMKKRVSFAEPFRDWTATQWSAHLQGVLRRARFQSREARAQTRMYMYMCVRVSI